MNHCLVALIGSGILSWQALAAAPAKPNILFLLADDLGWTDLGCYGATDIRTPRLDALAREGVRFTQFYANGPECSPTRTALLTGRYQQRVGGLECAIGTGNVGRYDDAIRLAAQHDLGMPASETTIARLLKNVGYATALIGKWHLGYEDKFAPGGHGFDHSLYCLGGGMDYFHHVEEPPASTPVLRLDGKPVQRDGYFTDLIADDALRWLGEHAKKPFFLYVPFTAPHAPFQGPDEKLPAPLPASSERWKQGQAPPRVYAAMIERMDEAVGRILDALNKSGVADRTMVIFTSDNGGTASARPSRLRGIKGTTFEGGIRVPGIVRWPGVLKAGVEYPHPALTFDLTASIARAAGAPLPAGRTFDGVDILHHVAVNEPPPARSLFWRQRRGDRTWRAVRDGALKFVSDTKGPGADEFLFDLDADPGEKQNLFPTRAAAVQRLKARLAAWEAEVKPVR
ncbi:MAG: sulfatase-like hydrolase/transferase [Verrucomicrobia bacterium]|nr:sulfatase-like hydrolase/transferase [Verrucomicrobiota bacterium]